MNRIKSLALTVGMSIGSLAAGGALTPALAVNLVQNGNFTPTTSQPTTIRWGNDNPNANAANLTAANQNIIPGWTSDGYNFIVPSGNGIDAPNSFPLYFYGSNLNAPNSANYFVAGDSAYQSGRIYQDLSGLVVGQQYQVSFYQAAAQQNGFVWDPNGGLDGKGGVSTTVRFSGNTTDNWIVNVGGTYTAPALSGGYDNVRTDLTSSFSGGITYVSPTMNLASQRAAGSQTYSTTDPNGTIISGSGTVGTASTVSGGNSTVAAATGIPGQSSTPVGWQQNSFIFTANDTMERLSFLSQGTPLSQPPFALLTGVSVDAVPTPEPIEIAGTLLGFGACLVLRSKLAKKNSVVKK
jgi:hypothetical protein